MKPALILICLVAAVLTFTPPAPAIAQDDVVAEKSPVIGSWKWTRVGLAGDVKCEMSLFDKDGETTGTYKDAEDVKAQVGKVSFEEGEVSVTLVFDNDGTESEIKLIGQLDGEKITGKIVDGADEQEWNARRFVSINDVTGKWRLEFSTPDGQTRNPEFELTVEDGEPVIEFSVGEATEEVGDAEVSNIKFKDGLLTFDIGMEFQSQDLKLEYELDLMGDEAEGLMFFEFGEGGGPSGDVEVTGERIK